VYLHTFDNAITRFLQAKRIRSSSNPLVRVALRKSVTLLSTETQLFRDGSLDSNNSLLLIQPRFDRAGSKSIRSNGNP
jgi:hypothetical protein